MKKRLPVLPNIITAFGLTCGLFVIFKMNMTEVGHVDMHVLSVVAGILLLGALADVLDGMLARALKAESTFGGIFDSLADSVTFGVAPSVIILKTLSFEPGTVPSFLMSFAAMIYSVSGILRLVRFNVMSLEMKESPDLIENSKKTFTGLPIPAAAGAVVSLNFFLFSERSHGLDLSEVTQAAILFSTMVGIGYLMISRWKFPSFKTLHIKVGSFRKVFLTVIIAVLLFYGILHNFPLTFLIISWGYVIAASVLSLIRIVSGRRNKALEEYEPDPETEED